MPLPSISKQTDNLKQLKLFFVFILFQLDVEDKKKILNSKLKKKELNKLIENFLNLEYISIFGKPLQFTYKALERFKKVVKQKLLGGRRYIKYDSDNKQHIFVTLFFCIVLDIYLKNLISFSLIQIAINFYLKMVIVINQSIALLHIVTFSKLVLMLAAIKLFCKRNNWTASIIMLTQHFVQMKLITKKLKEELFAYLIIIFACNQI